MKRQWYNLLALFLVLILISIFYIDVSQARTIYWGARGDDVRSVQQKLRSWGYYNGTIDGVYGKDTYRAVTYFQRKNGLRADGVVGSQTKEALGITTVSQKTSSYSKTIELSQRKLKQWGYYRGAVDGIYGSETHSAVVKFQRKNGLSVDGYVGPQTRKALGITQKSASTTKYAATSRGVSKSDDITLLAMAINGEARGESYTGQVAVGAVILNRVKHPAFPNSIAGVIYQHLAFEAVANGQIYKPIESSSYKAARDAMNGWDPTGGALYYWNPVHAKSKWIKRLKPTLTIGKHVFAKK